MDNLVEFLKKIINEINNKSDINEIVKKITENLVSKYGYQNNKEIENEMYNLLLEYYNKNIDTDTFIKMVKTNILIPISSDNINNPNINNNISVNNTNINQTTDILKNSNNEKSDNVKIPTVKIIPASSNNKETENITKNEEKIPKIRVNNNIPYTDVGIPRKNHTQNEATAIIDVDTEFINEVATDYNNIEENVKSNNIKVSQEEIATEATSLLEIVETAKKSIQEELDNVKNVMIESLTSIEYIDDQIKDVDFDDFNFNDIWNYSGNIIASGVKVADESFFEHCGYHVENNLVKVGEYTYNIKTHMLISNGVETKANIYIPSGSHDYSQLNTVTILDDVNSNTQSNAILISLGENDGLKIANVTSATKFVNSVTKTDLSKCQNIITGGSRFGARSLKFAADSGDLYQTIVCVNNAILVKGQNSAGKGKEAFENIEHLKKLDGKNIYIISSKNDDNLTMRYGSGSEFDRCNDVTKCYVYTGLNLVIENCPNSQIYFISNNDNPAFMDFKASNYHYGYNLWNKIASNADYSDHAKYHNIIDDMLTSNLTGSNGYNA